ncbi:NlpC/P60 family protein [Promicromonospora sp. NPDC023805]|uniref:NlpC/P60 family protein n=1 Tax=Promicromonospora sp. NPDC023805 TaxID=3154696 RepID=UPI0033CDF25F
MQLKRIGRVLAALTLAAASLAGSLGAQSALAPAAQAEASSSDPSIRGVHLECGGAEAYVSVRWWDSGAVSVSYTINDTSTSDGLTPKIQLTAHNTSQAQPYEFDGSGWLVMPLADTSNSGGFGSWNPSQVGHVLDLAVTLKNGLDPESGDKCTASRQIWNWGQNALRVAQLQKGTAYRLGGCEPYVLLDRSCLVRRSYSGLSGFGTTPRDTRSQTTWLEALATDGRQTKVDALKVSAADVQQGDLIFYDWENDNHIDHVAFYWSPGHVYDTSSPDRAAGVRAQSLTSDVAAVYRVTGVS